MPRIHPAYADIDGGCRRWVRSPHTSSAVGVLLQYANSMLGIARRISAIAPKNSAEDQRGRAPGDIEACEVGARLICTAVAPAVTDIVNGLRSCSDKKLALAAMKMVFLDEPTSWTASQV